MSTPRNIAEATRLTAEASALWQQSNVLTIAEYRAYGADSNRIHPDTVCEAGRPLREQATALRARAKELFQSKVDALDDFPAAGRATPAATCSLSDGTSKMMQTEFDAVVAAEVAKAMAKELGDVASAVAAGKVDPNAAARQAQGLEAATAREARGLEEDAALVRIIGGSLTLAEATAQRHEREAYLTDRAKAEDEAAADDAASDALAARIAAA